MRPMTLALASAMLPVRSHWYGPLALPEIVESLKRDAGDEPERPRMGQPYRLGFMKVCFRTVVSMRRKVSALSGMGFDSCCAGSCHLLVIRGHVGSNCKGPRVTRN